MGKNSREISSSDEGNEQSGKGKEEKQEEVEEAPSPGKGSDAVGGDEEEEVSPDLLKNTPSNISRLEDAIENCKAREKYRTATRSPSDGEDVRWYFCKQTLGEKELAASVPQTEIVGKGDYFRFSKRDSLALEASFLQREDELLARWWEEYAECSEGPNGSCCMSTSNSNSLYVIEEERAGVPVKGGLYEVDLRRRHCFPVYWHGENRRVLRGHWYARKGGADWLPLREDVAEQLELAYRSKVWHRRTFQPTGLFAARIDLQGSKQEFYALFTGEDDSWEAWLASDNSGWTLTGGGLGVKLRRGFQVARPTNPSQDELRQQKEEELDDYCSQVPVGHVVFMVHGIGQRLEKANLVDDVGDFRRVAASIAEWHLTPYQRSMQRVLFIPCQWRKGLKLSGESAVEKITLEGVRGLRQTLGATVHDVLYYMSPSHCQDIIDSVSNQLNRLYLKFLKRNPGYEGKVSIYGHSLGSVLSYDILCHQNCYHSESDQSEKASEAHENISILDKGQESDQQVQGTVEASSISDTTEMAKDRVSQDLYDSAELSTNLEEGSTMSSAPSLKEESHDSAVLPSEETQSSSSALDEDDKKPDHSEGTSYPESKGLDSNMEAEASEADSGCENTSQDLDCKDKLIMHLEDELKSLRTRIVELEKSQIGKGSKDIIPTKKTSCIDKHLVERNNPGKSYTPYIRYTKLDFKVDTFFAVGSPLGVFLALRNIRIGIGRGQDYWQDVRIIEEIPSCRQMVNIFHPFDPVAYRVEPLVCKEYVDKRPVIIPYHRGGKRLHIGCQEFSEDIATRSKAAVKQLTSLKVKVLNTLKSVKEEKIEKFVEDDENEEKAYGFYMIERLTGSENGRIDYVLQDSTFEHPYISALGAHTNYWRDPDTALFILKHLYHDIPEEPSTSEMQDAGSHTVNKRMPVNLFFERDILKEEIPLTFADPLAISEFSRKAKKIMK